MTNSCEKNSTKPSSNEELTELIEQMSQNIKKLEDKRENVSRLMFSFNSGIVEIDAKNLKLKSDLEKELNIIQNDYKEKLRKLSDESHEYIALLGKEKEKYQSSKERLRNAKNKYNETKKDYQKNIVSLSEIYRVLSARYNIDESCFSPEIIRLTNEKLILKKKLECMNSTNRKDIEN